MARTDRAVLDSLIDEVIGDHLVDAIVAKVLSGVALETVTQEISERPYRMPGARSRRW